MRQVLVTMKLWNCQKQTRLTYTTAKNKQWQMLAHGLTNVTANDSEMLVIGLQESHLLATEHLDNTGPAARNSSTSSKGHVVVNTRRTRCAGFI